MATSYRIGADGNALERSQLGLEPSAETSIHQTIYTLFSAVQACYHVHSIEANLVSRFTQSDTLSLPPLEMLKGLGVKQENPCCTIPIFPNHVSVAQIASEISDRFRANPPELPALLIRAHGVTVWASSLVSARNHIELVEYIFRYMVAVHHLGIQ